jgi:hypothetical protein
MGLSLQKNQNWFAIALCSAVMITEAVKLVISVQPQDANNSSPDLLPFVAAFFGIIGILRFNDRHEVIRLQKSLLWGGLLLMVWTANGLLFDLLRLTPLLPQEPDLPGMVVRTIALAAVIVLARIALAAPTVSEPNHNTNWIGYVAFVLALPYPVFRIIWAFGGTIGLSHAGAAGVGFAPLIIAIPWILAAVLSLFLVNTPRWMPRRFLLTAGWTATVMVAMIGPAAFWMIITSLVKGGVKGPDGMAAWVPFLFYGSWFLFAIAAGAATRAYQLRSAQSDII